MVVTETTVLRTTLNGHICTRYSGELKGLTINGFLPALPAYQNAHANIDVRMVMPKFASKLKKSVNANRLEINIVSEKKAQINAPT